MKDPFSIEEKYNELEIPIGNIYFLNSSSSKLDSQVVEKKIKRIKSLQSLSAQDLKLIYAEYDLARYFLAHDAYESAIPFFNRLNILRDKLRLGAPPC